MKILYVEDNSINRLIVLKTLERTYPIDAVETANEAFELAAKNDYDVYLIDINLNDPDIDGFGVLDELKQKKGNDPIYIAYTNFIGTNWVKSCLEAGFDHYLSKPLDLKAFTSFVEKKSE